jgi:hypothetical protein
VGAGHNKWSVSQSDVDRERERKREKDRRAGVHGLKSSSSGLELKQKGAIRIGMRRRMTHRGEDRGKRAGEGPKRFE